jgi:predicted ATPase
MLVACLREARSRRQVIIVTHNPNLAVVCDADQIIHSQIDKQNNRNKVTYTSGSMENPITNRHKL